MVDRHDTNLSRVYGRENFIEKRKVIKTRCGNYCNWGVFGLANLDWEESQNTLYVASQLSERGMEVVENFVDKGPKVRELIPLERMRQLKTAGVLRLRPQQYQCSRVCVSSELGNRHWPWQPGV